MMFEKLPYASSYQRLIAYRKAVELAGEVFQKTLQFPKEERYSLTDQIRRSSRSIGAQIAESWGKRRYIKHFISKLSDAYAETYETEHWILIAYICGYLSDDIFHLLQKDCQEICQLIGGIMAKAESFCG
jgi:four helix bundle protein